MLIRGELPTTELRPVLDFYRRLDSLSKAHGFSIIVFIMPVIDLLDQDSPPGFVEAVKLHLGELEVESHDGFEIWRALGAGRETFLPQGPDAHLNASGYERVASRLAEAIGDCRGLESVRAERSVSRSSHGGIDYGAGARSGMRESAKTPTP
jgi:hypothetical protein